MSLANKLVYCLLPNTNMAFGSYIMIMKESKGIGLTWANLSESAVPNDTMTVLYCMLITLVNMTLYALLTWYVTLAFPGEYGIPQPWYFPFSKKYWFPSQDGESIDFDGNDNDLKGDHQVSSNNLEANPRNLNAGIRIENLSKTYDGGATFSVNNLSLNMYENQITALLGHNGAGKTTTISILIGLYQPSKGTAFLNGYNIRDQIGQIRSSLGICPQFNVLFDELTVEEHLEFYCKLKHTSMSNEEIKADVANMIVKLDLVDKRKSQAKDLSGGMQRKLSVSFSILVVSKVFDCFSLFA